MVSTKQKALTKITVATQTNCLSQNASVQVASCRECLNLLLPMKGGRDTTCVTCEQVGNLISLVAENIGKAKAQHKLNLAAMVKDN